MEPTKNINVPEERPDAHLVSSVQHPLILSSGSDGEHKDLIAKLLDKLPSDVSQTAKKPLKRKTTYRNKGNATTAWTGKPRRPLSAYNFFFKEERATLLAERKRLENSKELLKGTEFFSAMGKMIAKRWKELPPSKMAKYQSLAEEDLKRYRVEKGEYVETKHKNMSTQSEPSMSKDRTALFAGVGDAADQLRKGATIRPDSLRTLLVDNSRARANAAEMASSCKLLRPYGSFCTEPEATMLLGRKSDTMPLHLPFANSGKHSFHDPSSLFARHLHDQKRTASFEHLPHGVAASAGERQQLRLNEPFSRTGPTTGTPSLMMSRMEQFTEHERARHLRDALESHVLSERGRIVPDALLGNDTGAMSLCNLLSESERLLLTSGFGRISDGEDRSSSMTAQHDNDSILQAQLRYLAKRDEAMQASMDISSSLVQNLLRSNAVPFMSWDVLMNASSAEALQSNQAALSAEEELLNSSFLFKSRMMEKMQNSVSALRKSATTVADHELLNHNSLLQQQAAMFDDATSTRRMLSPSSVELLLSALNSRLDASKRAHGS